MKYDWIDFYTELASKLLPFKNDRTALIQKATKVYEDAGLGVLKLESGSAGGITDIDPFTFFGIFNKGITVEHRIDILNGISKEFNISARVPNNFDGIPSVINTSAAFYLAIDARNADDIDNLWELFESALTFADKDTKGTRQIFSEWFDKVTSQSGVRWKITMGLFWVRPYTFISLDAKTREFISDANNISPEVASFARVKLKEMLSSAEYLELINLCRDTLASGIYEYTSFPELSYAAFNYKQENNANKNSTLNTHYIPWFKPLLKALIDLGGSATPKEACNKIAENEHLGPDILEAVTEKNNTNKFSSDVNWARSYLVYGGYIDGSVRGTWTITDAGRTVNMTDERASELIRAYNFANNKSRNSKKNSSILANKDVDMIQYWLYVPGRKAEKWNDCCNNNCMLLRWRELGDFRTFNSRDEINHQIKQEYDAKGSYKILSNTIWQFTHDMKIGDVIFAIGSDKEIIGRGIVVSNYEFDENSLDEYAHLRRVNWLNAGSWQCTHKLPQKQMLKDITFDTELVQALKDLFIDDDYSDDVQPVDYPEYAVEDFLSDVYMSEEDYLRLVGLVINKQNVILQGPPGVGKTYIANKLAFSMMNSEDLDRVMMVQFHQSYSYEDFIMGFRPTKTGFELEKGAFYNFCKKAEIDSDNKYFFIIDEINRGNLSKIFGELFMLIEKDKRGKQLQLLYKDEKFAVPENVYIIGMMNTADRSLAMLDYALRRRFGFYEIKPGFNTVGFRDYRKSLNNEKFNKLIDCVEKLNSVIISDESLGEGFCIGHSYFCGLTPEKLDEQWLYSVVEYELIPLLKEYWFDEPTKVKDWSENLRSAIK